MRCSLVNQGHGHRGGVLTSVTLLLALVAAGWFLWVLEDGVEAAEFTRVETANVRLDVGSGWSDPRWPALVAERVALTPAFDCEDAQAAAQIVSELSRLPFLFSRVIEECPHRRQLARRRCRAQPAGTPVSEKRT